MTGIFECTMDADEYDYALSILSLGRPSSGTLSSGLERHIARLEREGYVRRDDVGHYSLTASGRCMVNYVMYYAQLHLGADRCMRALSHIQNIPGDYID